MTLFLSIPVQHIANHPVSRVIEFAKSRFQLRGVVDALRRGEHLKAGDTEQVLTRKVGITGKVGADERFEFGPIRKLARMNVRSGKQNDLLTVHTAQVQSIGMSHDLIIARGANE